MANTDYFIKGARRFSTTIGVGGVTNGTDTTVPITTFPSDYSDGDAVAIVVDRVDTSGALTPDFEEVIIGVKSGSNLINCVRGVEGTAQAHAAGKVVEIKLFKSVWNRMVAGLVLEHNQDGTHKETALDSMITGSEAQGDIVYHNGTIWTRLPKGTDGQVLTQASNVPSWADGGSTDGWVAAGETWTYASADDPTFTFTIAGVDKTTKYYPGMRVKLTQTSAKYFIITKVAFSTDTTVTLYGGTDYDLANATITSPYYSTSKSPAGFPLDPSKWGTSLSNSSDQSQATPSNNTWYNLGSLSLTIPIGVWNVSYSTVLGMNRGSATILDGFVTLSTANNSESDTGFTSNFVNISATDTFTTMMASKTLALTSKTSYYLNAKSTQSSITSITFAGSRVPTQVKAICAYL